MSHSKLLKFVTIATVIPTSFVGTMFAVTNNKFSEHHLGNYNQVSHNTISSSSFTPFTHNYHSMSAENQEHYYPDINRENINLIHMLRNSENYAPYDWTTDRFRNVFYSNDTYVSIYDLSDNPYADSPQYGDYSVNTDWEAANGFAYLPDNTEEKGNTFYNFFAGDLNLAMYFDANTHPNIYTDICTYQTIASWVRETISTDGTLSIDLSTLLANDLDRDNAVLSLLNPMLWDAILKGLSEQASSFGGTVSIKSINLSRNNLRIVPNIASIPNKTVDDWMFWDSSYSNVSLQMNDIATSRYDLGMQKDGCIDTIDLSHNALTYLNFYSYRTFDKDHQWVPNPYYDPATEENRVSIYSQYTDYPSLLTLVKCRYTDYTYGGSLDSLMDGSYKNTLSNIGGVNLDYNYMPYFAFALQYEADSGDMGEPSYWQAMLRSWTQPLWDELVGDRIEFSYARDYLTYTTANYYNPDSNMYLAEYMAGLGAYQTDAYTSNDLELDHFYRYGSRFSLMNYSMAEQIKELKSMYSMDKTPSSIVGFTEYSSLYKNYLQNYLALSATDSCQVQFYIVPTSIVTPAYMQTSEFSVYSDDLHGCLELSCITRYAHTKYTPTQMGISDDVTLNQAANTILSLITLYSYDNFVMSGYAKSYNNVVVLSILYGLIFLVFMIVAVTKVTEHAKTMSEYKKRNHS